jgi:hypothetical protein
MHLQCILNVKEEIPVLIQYTVFLCINFNEKPDNGSQLEPKHVTVNKLKKTSVVCD